MQLYNTLSRSTQLFISGDDTVTVYVCGITPYDTTHLGHAFTYCVFDNLIRYLEFQGYQVRYVQNVTDIDDDILRKAKESGEGWQELGDRWTVHFIDDLKRLNVRPPDYFPRATDVISDIVSWVERLLTRGVAYESGGNVYYHVDAWSEFGALSHLPRSEMLPIANDRGNFPDDPYKRDPLDFVLWQAQQPGEPAWPSPWGPGRPGWHIECSTLSTGFLGETIDVHGGGGDLLFPHHECEIAQVEPLTTKPFVMTWMHAAMVYHEGEKMSKSLGNLVMVRDLLQTFSPDAIRLYLAGHHYRRSWAYDEAMLIQAADKAASLREAMQVPSGRGQVLDGKVVEDVFCAAMDDDLDVDVALSSVEELANNIRQVSATGGNVSAAQATLRQLCGVFGLQLDNSFPEARVTEGWDRHRQRFSRS